MSLSSFAPQRIIEVGVRSMKLSKSFLYLVLLIPLGCTPPATSVPTSQATIQGQSMEHMLSDVNKIRAFAYGSGSAAATEESAHDLVSWSRRLGELFPAGEATADYVDMSPERVGGAPAAMRETSGMLLVAVQNGNRPDIGSQLANTEKNGCGFCHLITNTSIR